MKEKIEKAKSDLEDLILYDTFVPYLEDIDKEKIVNAINVLTEVQEYMQVKS